MDELRKDCWNNAFHAFGTAYIFRIKAEKFKKYTSKLKFFGIAVPLTIGTTASGYGFDSKFLKLAIIISAPLTIIQLIVSVLATVNKWDEELSYSFESAAENSEIALRYENLAKYPPNNNKVLLEGEMAILKTKQESRDKQDDKHSITEKDERKGMRYSLKYYQRTCTGCGQIITSMKPSSCNICGNF